MYKEKTEEKSTKIKRKKRNRTKEKQEELESMISAKKAHEEAQRRT